MDLSPFKLDIDDLIDEFAKMGGTTLADMKKVWLWKKFSHIYQGTPTVKHSLFMQSLYSHAIAYIIVSDSLPRRLGGLYCLYCLYETQPFKPPFKIYLSLGELKSLRKLVADARENSVAVAPYLVKAMIERKMLLFGAVELNENPHTGMIGQINELQNARVRHAYEKLFANTRIEQFVHMDMDTVCDLTTLDVISSDYAEAKKLANQDEGTSTEDDSIAVKMRKISENWNSQRELFYQQTGLQGGFSTREDGDFGHALEMQLLENGED